MLSKLVGNSDAKQTLKRLVETGRLPNSLLLTGPDGVGKRQFALEIARYLICTAPSDDGDACGVCANCNRIGESNIPAVTDKNKDDFKTVFFTNHRDVATVVPYKNFILVDAIRDLEKEANFRPYEAIARFFVIDDADKMNDQAANALLKTLEEPPPTSYIFLITSRPDSLLPTIRSRCQTLRFAPVATADIEQYLINERKYSYDQAVLAARLARGSIGRAVSIDVAEFRTQRQRMFDVLKHTLETGDRAALLKISEGMNDAKNKEHLAENLDILASLIHDVWSLGVSGDKTRVVNTDIEGELAGLAQNSPVTQLPDWLKLIEAMRENFVVNINRKVATDALFITMASG
jgi:DNA polymerase-3 subunit delta'